MNLALMVLIALSAHAETLRDRLAGRTIRCFAPGGGGSAEYVFNADASAARETWINRGGGREPARRISVRWHRGLAYDDLGSALFVVEDGQLTQGTATPCREGQGR